MLLTYFNQAFDRATSDRAWRGLTGIVLALFRTRVRGEALKCAAVVFGGRPILEHRTVEPKHRVSLKQAQAIFDQAYIIDQENDDPEKFRAIGWSGGRLCSVIFEIRHDSRGEYCHLITAWRATKEEEKSYEENV